MAKSLVNNAGSERHVEVAIDPLTGFLIHDLMVDLLFNQRNSLRELDRRLRLAWVIRVADCEEEVRFGSIVGFEVTQVLKAKLRD